jgi:outer membrane receptor protein involved in Fe transport
VVSPYAEFINEPVFASGGFQQSNPKGFSGSNEVIEGFGEVVVPLLADVAMARSLDLNAALRVTDYSTSGTVTTWKVGATYEPIDGLLFRASRSRDIRAPSLFESFGSNTTYAQVDYPGFPSTPAVSPGRNNLDLSPEKADSTSFGMTMRNLLIPDLRLSVDYYKISLKETIGKLGSQSIVDRCFGIGEADGFDPDQSFCDLIDFNGSSLTIIDPFLNLGSIETEGVEFDVSYRLPTESMFGDGFGDLSVRVLANYVSKLLVNSTGLNPVDQAGDQAGVPHWRGTGTLSYENGPFGATLAGEYIGPMTRYNLSSGSFPDPVVGSIFYLDASLRYDVVDNGNTNIQIFANVDNLLDQEPPFLAGAGSRSTASPPGTFAQFHFTTNPAYYDQIGRRYRVGVRFSF